MHIGEHLLRVNGLFQKCGDRNRFCYFVKDYLICVMKKLKKV